MTENPRNEVTMVEKRRPAGRPASKSIALERSNTLALRSSERGALLPVTQPSTNEDMSKQACAQRKRKSKAKALVQKHKQRIHKCIGYTTLGASVCMLGLILASIILVVQVEYCRYPRHSKAEEFRYEIDSSARSLRR